MAWFAVHYVAQARDQGAAGTVAQGLAAVLVPVAGLAVWLVRQAQRDAPAIDLRQAADDLAGRVGRQWRDAALQRGLFDQPLAVRWTWSPRGLSGPVSAAVGDRRAPRIAPLPGLSRITSRQLKQGDLSDLFKVYGGLDSGRIALAGAPGAGKSGAMIRLLLDAVRHREGIGDPAARAAVPVPVLLTAYDWLPEEEGLAAWVTRRLEDEHPFLKATAGEVSAARALVDAGTVSVLLDGVDEMPEAARAAVLRQTGRQAGYRVVLSGRTGELVDAVDGGHLDGAAALELAAITAAEAAGYLQSRVVDPAPGPWRTLIGYLREQGTSPVAQALDSPLMLSLLLDTYLPGDPVDELTDPERFPGREQIEDHLLARVLPAAYAPRPGGPAPACTSQQAREWLGYLAARMNHVGTRDLAWWRIMPWLPVRHLMLVIGFLAWLANGLAAGLAFGIAAGIVFGLDAGLAVGLTVGLGAGLAFGLGAGLVSGLRSRLVNGLVGGLMFGVETGLAAGFMSGLKFGAEIGVADGLTVGFTVALTVGLTVGSTSGLESGLPRGMDTTAYNRFPPQYRGLRGRSRAVSGIASRLVNGLAAGLAFGLTSGLLAVIKVGLMFGLGAGFAAGTASGIAVGLASGLIQALNISMPADKLITPIDSWQGNQRLVHLLMVAAGLGAGLAAGVAFGIAIGVVLGLADGLTVGIAAGLAVGIGTGNVSASTSIDFFWPANVTFVLFSLAGHGPARMMDFLEDARKRGVLRTAGPVYQFRHARLQDLLAATQPAGVDVDVDGAVRGTPLPGSNLQR